MMSPQPSSCEYSSCVCCAEFIERYQLAKHDWTDTRPLRCELCNQIKLNAAFVCRSCDCKRMCRNCFHRVHRHEAGRLHDFYSI